jgi:hypothetical protein
MSAKKSGTLGMYCYISSLSQSMCIGPRSKRSREEESSQKADFDE